MLAGIATAEVDKLIETKGLDAIDRHKAHKEAERHAHALAEQRYGGGTGMEYAQQQGGYAGAYDFQNRGGAPWGTQGCPSYGYGGGGYAPPQGPPQGYYPPPGGYGGPPPPQGYGGGPPQGYGGGPPQGYGGGPPQGYGGGYPGGGY